MTKLTDKVLAERMLRALKGLAGIQANLLSGSFNAFNVYPSLNHS